MRNYILALTILAAGCTQNPQPVAESNSPVGSWRMSLFLGPDTLQTDVTINDSLHFLFHNAAEVIKTTKASYKNDSLFVEMPVFHSYFLLHQNSNDEIIGAWYNPGKSPEYQIPVSFNRVTAHSELPNTTDTLKYAVTFSEHTEDAYPAVGLFLTQDGHISGTFLTETGDYRYLEGVISGDRWKFQCFDGSHAFLFTATHKGDSLSNGTFYSGNHWSEPWKGNIDTAATLRNPYSLTYLVDESDFEFTAMNLEGEITEFNPSTNKGKVTIVQIFGSWCPNCLDESLFYKQLYSSYHDQGLEIVPVAFEKGDDFSSNVNRLRKYASDLNLPFMSYLGGKASKAEASKIFPMLNAISSFPTTIFLDRSGTVRRIHTGFYGPGTGTHYERFISDTRNFIEDLLNEETL